MRDRAGQPLSFDIVARTNVNILLGDKVDTPSLVCQDKTSGWGSDDIALTIETDGATLRDISNDEIGDFDQDDVRDLDQWIPETVVFLGHGGVKVIEEDDIDPHDVGVGRIPPTARLQGPLGDSRRRFHVSRGSVAIRRRGCTKAPAGTAGLSGRKGRVRKAGGAVRIYRE